jgi:predicted membrane GTPase involved in stress response
VGSIVDMMAKRKGEMTGMVPYEGAEGMTNLNFIIPTRGMIGMHLLMLEILSRDFNS